MECPVHGEGCPGCIEQHGDEYADPGCCCEAGEEDFGHAPGCPYWWEG